MKRLSLFLILLILLGCVINAQQITQQFTFSQNDLQISQSGDYDLVRIVDESFLQGEENAGKPQLPVKQFKLLLPQGASATNVSLTIHTESQLVDSFYLYPVQLPVSPNYSAPPAFVEPDPAIYNSDDPFPADYIIEYATGGFRDYNYVTVNFTPFRYIPLSRQLYLLTSITITVDYTVHTLTETHKIRPYGSIDVIAYEFINSTVINPAQTDAFYADAASKILQYQETRGSGSGNKGFEPTELPALEGSPVHYVIITNNTDVYGNAVGNFTDKFQEFADWKILSGSPAKVITVDAIRQAYPGVDIAEKIRQFIKDAHKLWGTEYVLLGGNASIVPVRWEGHWNMPTDLYYSAIYHATNGYDDNWNGNGNNVFGQNGTVEDCDFTPDIAVGRAPVVTDVEVDLFLEKNFTYFRCSLATSVPPGNWLGKHLNLQGIAFPNPWNTTSTKNGLHHSFDIIQAHHLDIDIYGMFEYFPGWETTHQDWCPAYYPTDPNGCTTNSVDINDEYLVHNAVVNQINQRYGIINHFDHSGPFGLGLCTETKSTTALLSSDFQNLNQTNKYGVFISGGCGTVPIERHYYISEQWINTPNGGVAFVGSSAINLFATPGISYNYNFFNSLYTSNIHNIGLTNSITASNSLWYIFCYKAFHLLGDPELSIYTDVPVNMSVTHNNTITTGNYNFNASVSGFPTDEEVKICLYKENEVYAFTESNTGFVSFNITPDSPGDMKLTVTCHNAEPYEAVIIITQNPGVHLYKSDLTIIDENGNGFIEPGEEIDLSIELSNSGAVNASSITGILTTTDANTIITQNTSAYPNVPSMQTGNSIVNYTFIASTNNIYHGKVIPFELEITSAQGQFLESFYLNIKNSQLESGIRTVLVNGVETTTFNLGDIAELFIDVHNYGTVTASNLFGVLSTGLPINIVSVTTGIQSFGDINSFEKATNSSPFTFLVGQDYNGEPLIFELVMTDDFGKTDVFDLDLTESLPALITGFDFSSGRNDITISWTGINNIKGYNIYRSDTKIGTYEKVNNFIVSGAPMYYDAEVDELSEYFYKVSVVSITGNEIKLDDLFPNEAWTSLEIHSDYPILVDNSFATGNIASVTVADIDDNETDELFPAFVNARDGLLMGFYETGEELFNIDGNTTTISGFAKIILPDLNGSTDGGELWSEAAVGDVDNDGNAEVFVTTSGDYYATDRGYLFGFNTVDLVAPNNQPDPLWNGIPKNLGHRSFSSPVLADLDGNGIMEIITNQEKQKISVHNYSGTLLWERQIGNTGYSFGYIAVADLNNDGTKEIIIGTHSPGAIYILNYDGTDFNGVNPIYTSSTHRFDSNPVIADIDSDDEVEIIITGKTGNYGNLYAFNTDGSFVSGKWDGQISIGFMFDHHLTPQAAIGDLNNDGSLEVAIAGYDKIYVFDNAGNIINGFPIYNTALKCGRSSPVLADVDNDDDIEIIFAASDDRIYAFNPDATECIGWRLSSKSPNGFAGTPTISDIDNDGFNEIIISDSDCKTHVWKTTGDADKIEWGSYRANAQNTGEYKIECKFSDDKTKEITGSNVIWDTYKHIQGDLIIKTNANLSIQSKTTFVEGGKIIVEPGATLTVDGGFLTNKCGSMWQGIQVWGDSDASQYTPPGQPCAQGKLILKNSAVIENAVVAVNLWKPGYYETTGGIVYASGDVVFRNNAISVRSMQYRNFLPSNPSVELDNFSNFENCTFEITNYYRDDAPFNQHVILYHVKGIDFHACDFTVNSNTSGVSEYSQAIFTFNTGLNILAVCNSIISPCTDWDPCTFTGFYNAIEVLSDGSTTNTLFVNRAVFNNNIYGVKIYAVNNAVILYSDFNIGENTVDICCDPAGIGIYLESATGFAFEENNFTKYPGAPSANYIGISINNTEASDEVYNNDFDNLSYANYSDGINWGQNVHEGLTYFCNENTNNYADFFVAYGSGIQSSQGDIDHATGNKFSPTGATWHFYNEGNHLIDYYYYLNGSNETPDDNLISNVSKHWITAENLCTSHYDEDPPDDLILDSQERLNAEQEYFANLTDYNNVKVLFDNLVDGGSTSTELSDIQTAQPQDMWTLRAQLLGDSPHLSMEVLKAAADKTEVLTESALFDILAANPDELKKEELIKYLEEKQDPLPAYMIDILRSVANGTTYKTVLQQQMARYNRTKTRAAHDIIRSNLHDSITNNNDLRNWLDNVGGLSSDRQIIATYIQDNNFTNAYTFANMIPQLYMLTGDELTEHNYFMDIIILHDTLSKQGRNIFQLDSTEINALVLIADNSHSLAGIQAKSILEAAYDHHYTNCPRLDSTAGYKNIRISMDALNQVYGLEISVKPNPAKQWAAFDYILPENKSKATITIRDVTGKTIEVLQVNGQQGQKLWDTRQIEHGVYIYTLKVAGLSKSGKIIISK